MLILFDKGVAGWLNQRHKLAGLAPRFGGDVIPHEARTAADTCGMREWTAHGAGPRDAFRREAVVCAAVSTENGAFLLDVCVACLAEGGSRVYGSLIGRMPDAPARATEDAVRT